MPDWKWWQLLRAVGIVMKPGDAECLYDGMVLLGMNPVPWQFHLLAQMEQEGIDQTFRELTSRASN